MPLRWMTIHRTPDLEEGVPLGRKVPVLAGSERRFPTAGTGRSRSQGGPGGRGTQRGPHCTKAEAGVAASDRRERTLGPPSTLQ